MRSPHTVRESHFHHLEKKKYLILSDGIILVPCRYPSHHLPVECHPDDDEDDEDEDDDDDVDEEWKERDSTITTRIRIAAMFHDDRRDNPGERYRCCYRWRSRRTPFAFDRVSVLCVCARACVRACVCSFLWFSLFLHDDFFFYPDEFRCACTHQPPGTNDTVASHSNRPRAVGARGPSTRPISIGSSVAAVITRQSHHRRRRTTRGSNRSATTKGKKLPTL